MPKSDRAVQNTARLSLATLIRNGEMVNREHQEKPNQACTPECPKKRALCQRAVGAKHRGVDRATSDKVMVGELPDQPYLTAETLGEAFELGPPERYLGCGVTADLTNLVQKIRLLLGHQIDPRRAVELREVEPQSLEATPAGSSISRQSVAQPRVALPPARCG